MSAQRRLRGDLRENCVWSAHLKSLMTMHLRHSGTPAHFLPSLSNHQHVIPPHFTCHSGISFSGLPMNTVCSCSVKFSPIRAEATLSKICFGGDRVWVESRWYWDWAEVWCSWPPHTLPRIYSRSWRPRLWQQELLWLIFTLWHEMQTQTKYREKLGCLDMAKSCKIKPITKLNS